MALRLPLLILLTLVSAVPAPRPATRPATLPVSNIPRWQLRSKHWIYGMPLETDDRYQMRFADGRTVPGISVVVKEGFVVGHYDRLKVPAWVCTRWTEKDYRLSKEESYNERHFKDDDELPNYAIGGTSLDFNHTGLQRGHMARQEDNKAWGSDNVDEGCEMSNIAPQIGAMNAGIWNTIEDLHRSVVANPATGIKAIWVISGTIFERGKPERTVGKGIGVPDACYKVLGWFDKTNHFHCAAFIVHQEDRGTDAAKYLVPVRAVEQATGLDFFSELPDDLERRVETERALW